MFVLQGISMDREVYFKSEGVRLYGTLTIPDGTKKSPACLFIGGSMPQTREGDIDNSHKDWFPKPLPQRKLFHDEAKIFNDVGLATFRYDKRGCGKSEGDFNSTALFDLIEDARVAVKWLKTQSGIDPLRVGVLGQSEGAMIALVLAVTEPGTSFYIWQGGIYSNLRRLVRWQAENFFKTDEKAIEGMKKNAPLIYWVYKQVEEAIAATDAGEGRFRFGDENYSYAWNMAWWREHFQFSAPEYLERLKCPVLLLHGELDHNTPASEAEKARNALLAAGNENVNMRIFKGLDHSFRRLEHKDEDFVSSMAKPLDPAMAEVLRDWLETKIT
ncbi:alpha/beta hydrolase family protein [Candidatus Riflebacteria bacterium]